MLKSLRTFRALLSALGLRTVIQILTYHRRNAFRLARAYSKGRTLPGLWRARRFLRATPPPDWDALPWTFVGGLVSFGSEGRDVTLQCENAAVRLTILAPDLVRVRLSRDGRFPPPFSYAVSKPDREWPEVAYHLEDGDEAMHLRTSRLVLRIDKRPCRLTFLDPDGQEIQADAEGLGWSESAVVASKLLTAEEHIYGLGEKAFGLDLRGRALEMWNTDPQGYGPGRDPLYLNIPFYLGLRGTLGYGVFFDNSYRAHFDLGASQPRRLSFAAAGGEMRYYFLYGPSLRTVLERYTDLTGRMPLPPLWALGYHQSRWSYYPERRVMEVAGQFRARSIPCDAIHLDIDYMRGYRCFTWHSKRFPNPRRLVGDLRGLGFRTVVILDPAIKADRRYAVCRRGLSERAFCTYADGQPYKGPVWPGDAYFPDFTSPRVRRWWAGLCHELWAGTGVNGIWNDMNEPAVFGHSGGETLPDGLHHALEGRGGSHAQAHNVYGMQMARATREGWQERDGAERPLVITRAGHAGVQRYAAHWTGDNESTWEHLRLTLPMLLNLGLSGLAFTGCDTGGFAGDPDGEMLVRWTQLSAFTPYFRNHTAVATPPQEPWTFGEPYESLNRAAIELRYQLLPYIYTAFWQCAERGLPIVRPLFLDFQNDPESHPLDNQFLLGDSLLVAPVLRRGARSRLVYLPAGTWFHYFSGIRCQGPATVAVDAPLAEVPLYARAGSVIPTWPLLQYIGQRLVSALTLRIYPGNGTSWLYEDDGASLDYQRGGYRVTRFALRAGPDALELWRDVGGAFEPEYGRQRLMMHGLEQRPVRVLVDGEPLTRWRHDSSAARLEIHLREFEHLRVEW